MNITILGEDIISMTGAMTSAQLNDVALPGFGFHPLKGDREGDYAITVTGNYRMTFRFERGDVWDLNLEDYH